MTLTQLEYLIAVAETRSFVKAADRCHVTQPSLSAQIKKLEEELDITLFDRSPQSGVRITDIGQRVLEHARQIIRQTQILSDECYSFKNEFKGQLRLGLIPTIGPYLVPYFLAYIEKNFPELSIKITEDSTEKLIHDLDKGVIDAAILSTPKKATLDLVEKNLYYEPFMVYSNLQHPFAKQGKVKFDTLSDHQVTLLNEAHCMRDQVVAACGNVQNNLSQFSLELGSLQTLISLVDNNEKSFTLIPKLAEKFLNVDKKKASLTEIANPTPYRKISLVYHKHFSRKSLIQAVVEAVQKSIPESVSTQLTTKDRLLDPSMKHFNQTKV